MNTTTAPSTTAAFPPVIELSPADAREVLRQVLGDAVDELLPELRDAHLAALAIEGGWTLVSTDNDFRRFSGLDFLNPAL